jgi:hypothetical protein
VILDIYMPGYTGLEVCERVKHAAATSSMPVLLSVGKLEPYREQDATAVQADGVIVKPFEASELVTIVTNVILRASVAIDAATRPPAPPVAPATPVAIQASPAAEPKPLPAVDPGDYAPELENLESQAQEAGPAGTYSPATVSNGNYLGTSLPSQVEPDTRERSHSDSAVPAKETLLAMAVPATAAATGPANFAANSPRAVEANSSMPFMIDELLKAEEKAPEEDSDQRFSGPALDVSPAEPATPEPATFEPATEEIEIIDIPAPEPSAVTPVGEDATALSPVPAEANGDGTGNSPEELTAIEVDAFLREHAAGAGSGAGSGMASAIGVKSDSESDAQVAEDAGAIAAEPNSAGAGPNEPVAGANETHAPAVPASATEDQAAPRVAEGDNRPVFEAKHSITPDSASAVESAPGVEELAARFDVEKPLVAADITAKPAPPEPPAAVAEVPEAQKPEPESAAASPSPANVNEASVTPEDFMFSVPMMLEGTAAMSLPELPGFESRAGSESAASSAFGAPKYTAEATRLAALDGAAIAGAVQRVMDRFKPQIVAEIVRELTKHKQ